MYGIQQFDWSLDSGRFGEMFQKWIKRHRKCIAHNTEYFNEVDGVVSVRQSAFLIVLYRVQRCYL